MIEAPLFTPSEKDLKDGVSYFSSIHAKHSVPIAKFKLPTSVLAESIDKTRRLYEVLQKHKLPANPKPLRQIAAPGHEVCLCGSDDASVRGRDASAVALWSC